MYMPLGKIFNHWSLLVLNIMVIFVVEISGEFFANTGLIHLLAIIFILLAIIRASMHPHVHDQFLEPIIHRGILAMLIFAISHIVEFSGYMIFSIPDEAISANVVNFYLASTLIVITGVEAFVGRLDNSSRNITKAIEILVVSFGLLILYILFNTHRISLSSSSWMTYAYTVMIISVNIFSLWRLQTLKQHVPIMTNFINYFFAAFVFIGLSALLYTFERILGESGISTLQVVYLNHFLFYGALSLIFLAYDRLLHLGGIYDDLEKMNLNR